MSIYTIRKRNEMSIRSLTEKNKKEKIKFCFRKIDFYLRVFFSSSLTTEYISSFMELYLYLSRQNNYVYYDYS